MPRRSLLLSGIVLWAAWLGACDRPSGQGTASGKDTAVVFIAASLTNAIRPQLDSFAAARGVTLLTESGASMEHVRKLTELHRIPDLILLADDDVFPKYLAPNYTSWWADFARNRMVVAYTDRSKAAKEISDRSEEHTSELQSRVDISYAVFCL